MGGHGGLPPAVEYPLATQVNPQLLLWRLLVCAAESVPGDALESLQVAEPVFGPQHADPGFSIRMQQQFDEHIGPGRD